MNYDTALLEGIAARIGKERKPEMPVHPDVELVIEIGRLYLAIDRHMEGLTNDTQQGTFLNKTLTRLITICDTLYDVYNELSPDTRQLVGLLTKVKTIVPIKIDPRLKLPKAFIKIEQPMLREAWLKCEALLITQDIDPILLNIAAFPIDRFEKPANLLNWGNYSWVRAYLDEIENTDWENAECNSKTEALISLLLRMDLNIQRFYAYVYKMLEQRLKSRTGKKEKLDELRLCAAIIHKDSGASLQAYQTSAVRMVDRLDNWLWEEEILIRAMAEDTGMENPYKLEHETDVLTLAFWYKLLYDHKFFKQVTIDEFADRIARNCSIPRQAIISAISLKTKFYTKRPEVIRAIEKLLVAMLTDVRLYLQ